VAQNVVTLKDALVEKLTALASAWKVGDPSDPDTRVGPLVTPAHLDTVLNYVVPGAPKAQALSSVAVVSWRRLYTRDLGCAHRVSHALRAGTVSVNCYSEGDITPFGGFKVSGFFGRDKSVAALERYSEQKTIWIHVGG
jgi:acyl-CoA reductase-like NAD-dependent aldehyde dehydrogenase